MPERQTPWERNQVFHRKGIVVFFLAVIAGCVWLTGRLAYLMIFQSEYYMAQADELHERERAIKAARGEIYDANGTVIAANRTVCTISVVHNQVTDGWWRSCPNSFRWIRKRCAPAWKNILPARS